MTKPRRNSLFFKWHPPLFYTIVLFISSLLIIAPLSANQLENHSSPYLALHGKDPVNWMEWGQPALDKAKKENKLLFVSIGYFACHWCHVMQRESYSDKGIAKLLNKDYISIKVDRELNPVLDKRLIEFVQVTNGTAGWPLNVFITPEGYPLVGATYLPREHFSNVLKELSNKWKSEQVSLSKQAKDMSKTLVSMLEKQERKVTDTNIKVLSDKFVSTALKYADTLQGGFGQQRKFPQIPQLWALLKLNRSEKNAQADTFIKLTLQQMAQKGLHDEVAGGFYRYTTDPDWEIPHFEKMLYTNAMMPLLYFDAADQYKNDSYRQTAIETLHFLQDEMRGSSHAFIASLSAVDSENVEGGYYLWRQSELKKILDSKELKAANIYWNLNRPNELDAGNLPRQDISVEELSKRINLSFEEATVLINKIKLTLKKYRNKNRKIPRDIKLLSGLNGLTLAAFARGAKDDPSFSVTGKNLSQFLINLWDGKTLRRSAANAKPGTLYDYAAVSWGLIKWGKASNDKKSQAIGKAIAITAWNTFYKGNNWIENPNSLLPQGVQQAHISDSALLSSEALLLEASLLSKDSALKKKVDNVLNNITRSLQTDLYAYASLLALVKRRLK
ncbi:MAG: DUF255 domain-containing protein [Cocleimonas sp.]